MRILTMWSPLKIRTLFITVSYILFDLALVRASVHNNLPDDLTSLETGAPTLEAADKDGLDVEAKERLPLVKVARENVMDLLHLYFIAKPSHIPSYTPLLQQFGVRINWFELLWNLWTNERKGYAGGLDFHFRGPLQLSIDMGYTTYQPKDIAYGNQLKHMSKGLYGLGALLYVLPPSRLSHAYFGIAYGQSHFDLITFDGGIAATPKPFVAGWIKLVGASELRLIPNLYGGMQFGLAYLVHCKKNDDKSLLNYSIPGYGKIANTIMPDITLYLKWRISFLEKKIVV